MKLSIKQYKTLVFDCDGVILDSNKVKTNAFYQAALPYGKSAAQTLVKYHVANGGVSRYKKFAHFLKNIVTTNRGGDNLKELLMRYSELVVEGLLNCDVAPRISELRKSLPDTKWLIVSGGDQKELREVFKQRGIFELFDSGIFGSPDTKELILEREISNGNVIEPALFLGDSKYDYQAASQAGLDFVFISKWTEVSNWETWCSQNNLSFISTISS